MKIISTKKNVVEIGDIVLHEQREKIIIPDKYGLICLLDLHNFKKFMTNDEDLDARVNSGEIKLLIKHDDIIIKDGE